MKQRKAALQKKFSLPFDKHGGDTVLWAGRTGNSVIVVLNFGNRGRDRLWRFDLKSYDYSRFVLPEGYTVARHFVLGDVRTAKCVGD